MITTTVEEFDGNGKLVKKTTTTVTEEETPTVVNPRPPTAPSPWYPYRTPTAPYIVNVDT